MEIKRCGSRASGKGPADWFTGAVRIDPLLDAPEPARVAGASVTFDEHAFGFPATDLSSLPAGDYFAQAPFDSNRELRSASEEGLSAEELERAKRKLASVQVLRGETPYGRLMHVGFDWQYRRQILPLNDSVDAQLRVTREQANELLRRRPFDQMAVVALGPIDALN